MRYFAEIKDYKTYAGAEDDFHFIYNANTGGGQSFLGGKFQDINGNLVGASVLNGRTAVFRFRGLNNHSFDVRLEDLSTKYEIKPRAEGDVNMKLSVGSKPSPNVAIAAFLMLPEPCGVKRADNIDVSVLTSNNYWIQSMWMNVDMSEMNHAVFELRDCVICGGVDKQGNGTPRYFAVDFNKRISDVIASASMIKEDNEITACIRYFADVYSGGKTYVYTEASEMIKSVMKTLSEKYPDRYSGIMDPLPILTELVCSKKTMTFSSMPLQLIRYGAPGTGKSHKTDEVVKTHKDTVRTTFHPDSDYSSFVGCYKPMKAERPMYGLNGETTKRFQENGKDVTEDYITYKFIPQAFAKAYVRAWRKMAEDGAPQFLVIEEINRGNCAQVFGDLFQLLDRDEAGMSKYPIEGEADFAAYLKDELRDIDCTAISNLKFAEDTTAEEVISGAKLVLPPNLHIWATMNTSDQSLFPMDSAFKRRWEWEYVPVGGTDKGWRIVADGTEFRWTEFLDKINAAIFKATQSEDKQLGHFFAKAGADGVVPLTSFVNKVLFFVFNDVLRDYDLPGEFSRSPGGPKFAFKDFFTADGSPNETEVKALLTRIVGHSESTAAH